MNIAKALAVAAVCFAAFSLGCDATQEFIDSMDSEQFSQTMEGVEASGDAISATAKAVAPLLPPWASIPIMIAAAAAPGLVRAWSNKQKAKRIVTGLEAGKDEAGDIKLSDKERAEKVKEIMGPAARDLVDEARGKRKGWPI